jgi:hypothetical protein
VYRGFESLDDFDKEITALRDRKHDERDNDVPPADSRQPGKPAG